MVYTSFDRCIYIRVYKYLTKENSDYTKFQRVTLLFNQEEVLLYARGGLLSVFHTEFKLYKKFLTSFRNKLTKLDM